jgi:23S rRNA G2445 N2-methylase RlmL
MLEKKIKKNIYGKPQVVNLVTPPGLVDVAMTEVQHILQDLWFPQKYDCELSASQNQIRIDHIHMFTAIELLIRSQCLSDVRLVIYESKAFGKITFEKKCRDIDWALYLNQNMAVKIKVDSVASKAFHESGLKEILSDIVKDHVKEIVSGDDSNEATGLYVDLYKNKLKISISLAGSPLYRRGYRGILSASAPLREDAASCCIRKSLQFAKHQNERFSPEILMIPFSGTGTFAFEYILSDHQLSPVLLQRDYALQLMPLFRQEHFSFLLKKAQQNGLLSGLNIKKIYCIDSYDKANAALSDNLDTFRKLILNNGIDLPGALFSQDNGYSYFKEDFLEMSVENIITASGVIGDVFIPLNPPYGIRLAKNSDTPGLYKRIADKINEIATAVAQRQKEVAGFILCPSEDAWSVFYKNIQCSAKETYHFTQGGLDVRVCQFYFKCLQVNR